MARRKQNNFGVFTKNIDGQTHTMTAATPADAVRLVFDGWQERKPTPVKATAAVAQPDDGGEAAKTARGGKK